MIELELFYEKAVVAIREEQADYLKHQRSQPFPQELPTVDEASAKEYAKMKLLQKLAYHFHLRKQRKAYKKALKRQKYPVDEVLTRGYNAGIEMSLERLEREFKGFKKRIENSEE